MGHSHPSNALSFPLLFFFISAHLLITPPSFLLPCHYILFLFFSSSSSLNLHFLICFIDHFFYSLLLRPTGVASVPAEAAVADGIAQSLAISYNNAGKNHQNVSTPLKVIPLPCHSFILSFFLSIFLSIFHSFFHSFIHSFFLFFFAF